ncbi:MBL fold metallo-hydrolase [Corynebacterium pseudopelargi]|uniref:Ribonuclease Z n=1 Tax=Corynebacterium pseudopelargi TaxID=2080757 RepID=A0A3G6ISJ5_9CORY|nr:MBL fold metallo-hydrolase [Corynebacterium pseudopelargi]AZA08615.1 Ribonuclease Z [Corynebacterium pseudopelargi]
MKVIVLGSSGSVGAPENPASGYLILPSTGAGVLMDLGPGVLGQLQRHHDPNDAHVVFSHLHADHCLDFPSLMVWRRYHPQAPAAGRNLLFGPAATFDHLGRLSADEPDQIDDMSDTFAFSAWKAHQTEILGSVNITPYPMIHPVETYALRIEEHRTGAVLAYSGDTAWTSELIECARDADVLLCEATWGASSEGKAPDMHLSGAEAGRIAREAGVKRLVLVHIPPWGDPEAALAAAREEFSGPVEVSYSGMEIDC